MHVERYGHGGAPILLIHGFGTCSFLWRTVGPALAVANRTAFAIDMFGYGESDRPFDAQFGIAAQSDYVDRALTALRLSKATVVGIDLGGAVAMHLAFNRPERVERLLLVNPIAFEDVPADDIKTMQRNTARFALRISRGVLGAAPLLRELLERSVADRQNMPDALVARYLAPYVGQEGVNHLLALARAVDDEDMAEVDLAQLDCPTLVVWGDQDPFVSPRLGDQIADTIPGSRLVRLPGTGRLVPEEAPDTLAGLLLEFVGAAGIATRSE
ncbi:MAG TPA: alpha/beta hydrolase [Gemmatimonadaceae bacterium]|nr:alpha/beta hydrolase [Gemmatimonadaceae bacterium]